MSAVEVVIVAHNAGDLLEAAVASVLDDAPQTHTIVVDNASTDGAAARVVERFASVSVISAENRGFAAGNNLGIAATTAPWLLLLNPDAELTAGSLDTLLAFGNGHPRAGIIGPEVLNPDGTRQAGSRGRFPSLVHTVDLRARRAWQRLRGDRSFAPPALPGPTSVPWLTGACMLVRREAIEAVGPLDEGFFLYYEDVDWCHRMHDAGWDVVVVPAAHVVHHLGRAATPSGFVAEKYRESFYRYCGKYHLWGLALCARVGLALRAATGGRR